MTMTDAPAAVLGEFPPPPPCPSWCESDHATRDFRSLVSWIRYHRVSRGLEVRGTRVSVWVSVTDRFWAEAWEPREMPELVVSPGVGHCVTATQPEDIGALVALAGLISPEVGEAVQAAALLVRSPEVTPVGGRPASAAEAEEPTAPSQTPDNSHGDADDGEPSTE
jgi:hypothetical protein